MKEDDAFLRIRKVRRETKHIMIICSSKLNKRELSSSLWHRANVSPYAWVSSMHWCCS